MISKEQAIKAARELQKGKLKIFKVVDVPPEGLYGAGDSKNCWFVICSRFGDDVAFFGGDRIIGIDKDTGRISFDCIVGD